MDPLENGDLIATRRAHRHECLLADQLLTLRFRRLSATVLVLLIRRLLARGFGLRVGIGIELVCRGHDEHRLAIRIERNRGLRHRQIALWRAGVDHYVRSEEHTSELQSLMRISYAVFCLKKTNKTTQ